MKKLECSNIKKELRNEIAKFIDAINDFNESDGEDSFKYIYYLQIKTVEKREKI